MPTASAGMVFTIHPNISNGSPIAQNFPDVPGGGESNLPIAGRWTVTMAALQAAQLSGTRAVFNPTTA